MKRIVSFVMAAGMALSLAACGGAASSTASTSTSAPAASSAAAADSGEILIGCLQDITGNTSGLGLSVQKGAQAAVDEINANGGINGKKIVMNTYDTKGDVTEAVNSYITAVTVDQVSLIVGPPVANIANAIKETSEGYDVPVVGLAMDPACQTKSEGVPYKNIVCFAAQRHHAGRHYGSLCRKERLQDLRHPVQSGERLLRFPAGSLCGSPC